MQRESLGMKSTAQDFAVRITALAHLQDKPTWSRVPWTRRKVFSFSFLYVFSNLLVSGIQGQTEISLFPKPQTSPSGVNSNRQRATNTDVCDWFPLIRMRSMSKPDELFGGEGNVGAARPTKHTKFKTNKLTTAASSA